MAKMIEVRLRSMTCEFAGNDDGELEVNGLFQVLAFDNPSAVSASEVLFNFPNGPFRMHEGERVTINHDVRILMATPSVDPATGDGSLNVRFGGELAGLGAHWATLHTNEIVSEQPRPRRFYFGEGERVVRVDFSTAFVHDV